MQPHLTFIQISDTHIGPVRDYDYYGYRPIDQFAALVDHLNGLPEPPDFVIHTGDVAQHGETGAYALAQTVLERLQLPIYYVNGNHDDRVLLRAMLGAPEHASGNEQAPLDYVFTVKGERFIVLDAHSDTVEDPLGYVHSQQLEWLRAELERGDGWLTVFLHYPLFPLANAWYNEHMLITNGEALHAVLKTARDRLRGVFLGHQHRAAQVVRDGILYRAANSAMMQYAWRPWDVTPQADHDALPGYSVVQCYADRTTTLDYSIPRV